MSMSAFYVYIAGKGYDPLTAGVQMCMCLRLKKKKEKFLGQRF